MTTRILAWGGAKNHPLKYSNIKTNSSQAVITNTIESTFLCEFFILSLRCVLELSDSAASTGIITIAFVIEAPRSNRDNRLAVISSRRRCHIPLCRLASSPLPSPVRGSPFRPRQSLGCYIIATSVSSWKDSRTLFSIATLLSKHV